ncbi:hypothetical protein TWF730_003779 [Orbilia blumenaviensis]|uniref:Uncharacterized protein n=1 Tax=Orbilia blumenaviensis TaxID=1796055 RepID=A0AAV9U3V4_9PEZI
MKRAMSGVSQDRPGSRLVDELEAVIRRKRQAGDFTRSIDVPRLRRITECIAAEVELYPAFPEGEDDVSFTTEDSEPLSLDKERIYEGKVFLLTHDVMRHVLESYSPAAGAPEFDWFAQWDWKGRYPAVDRNLRVALKRHGMRTDAIFIPDQDHSRWHSQEPAMWKLAQDTLETERYIHSCTDHAILIFVVHKLPDSITNFDIKFTDSCGSVRRFEEESNLETIDYNVKDVDHYVGCEIAKRFNGVLSSNLRFPRMADEDSDQENQPPAGDGGFTTTKNPKFKRINNREKPQEAQEKPKQPRQPKQKKLGEMGVIKRPKLPRSEGGEESGPKSADDQPASEQSQKRRPRKRSKTVDGSEEEVEEVATRIADAIQVLSGEDKEAVARGRASCIVRLSHSCLTGPVIHSIWQALRSRDGSFLCDFSARDLARAVDLLGVTRKVRTMGVRNVHNAGRQKKFISSVVFASIEKSNTALFLNYFETALMTLVSYLDYKNKLETPDQNGKPVDKTKLLDEMCREAVPEAMKLLHKDAVPFNTLPVEQQDHLLKTIRAKLHDYNGAGKFWHGIITTGLEDGKGLGLGALIMFDFFGDAKTTRYSLYKQYGPRHSDLITSHLERSIPGIRDIRVVLENIALEILGFRLEKGHTTACRLTEMDGDEAQDIANETVDRARRVDVFREALED